MSTFMEKLNAMEARLMGLSSHVESTLMQGEPRKSHCRDKVKRIEISDEDDDMSSQSVTSRPTVTLGDGTAYKFLQT